MFKQYSLKHRLELFKRYRQIVQVLAKYGFGEVLGRLNIAARLKLGRGRLSEKDEKLTKMNYAVRIRLALEELGPTFIKFGQVLSTRPFLIPLDLVIELSKLQDEVPPFEFRKVRNIIETELKASLDSVFETFEHEPVASASLSQVHVATLKDGQRVAVKVQRPNVNKTMKVDMDILRDMARLFEEFVPESRRFDPSGQVDELAKVSRRETDFLNEGRNMEIFQYNFQDSEDIIIPQISWKFTTSRVLTCEYIDGTKISSLDKLKQLGLDNKIVARNGLRAILKMIFIDRFFHGDPHPGNIFVLPKNRIALLDFGMVGQLSESVVEFLIDLISAISDYDARKIIKTLLDFNLVPEDVDRLTLESEITEFIYRYHRIPLWQMDMRALSMDAMDIFYRHNIHLPASFMLLLKAMITAEEVGRMVDPEINLITEAEPFIKSMAKKQMGVRSLRKDAVTALGDLRQLLTTLPFEARRITTKLRQGKIVMQFQHRGLENLTEELYQSSKRLSLALIIAAVLISASLINSTGLGVSLFGLPVLSLLGYLLAGGLAVWLIFNIMRSGRK
ncbi:MAG: ubiquinone biosynthesis protein UbiB [candidate division Zixibacteria bacterium]|nr:ubiquinone biosynthesis protein UbiB [candidate division Zixibacteria bacterium]